MEIVNCTLNDLPNIISLYNGARSLQEERNMVIWPYFEDSFLKPEIIENRQWKITENSEIRCNWTISFNDKEIWEDKDKDDAIYIHRICTNPKFRGNRYIDWIVAWAIEYARLNNRRFVRLDTLGNNSKLIQHYTSAGFAFLGIFRLKNTKTLPKHYQDEPNCCLFEIDIKGMTGN